MDENSDRESRTEAATDKRVKESIDAGRAPVATDVGVALSFCGIWIAVVIFAADAATRLTERLSVLVEKSGTIEIGDVDNLRSVFAVVMRECLPDVLKAIVPIAALATAGLAMQSRKAIVWSRIAPQMSRVSPVKGLARLLSRQHAQTMARTVSKLALLTIGIVFAVRQAWRHCVALAGNDGAQSTLSATIALATPILSVSMILLLLLGALEYGLLHHAWRRDMRMTRHEIQQEMKRDDGDRQMGARRRAAARQRIREHAVSAVPRATVVLVNPTHYAVALRYVPDENAAPVLVAKGQDIVALTIREVAEAHGIPIVENAVLARALHKQVKVEQQIPHQFYRAVADVLAALRRNGRLKL